MRDNPLVLAHVGVLLLLLIGCQDPAAVSQPSDLPAFAQAPADGNGRKLVFTIDQELPGVDCGGGTVLAAHIEGWIQARVFEGSGSPNVELDVFHTVTTFTSPAGKTYAFHDVGPDHYFIRGGDLIVASSGRLGGGLIGRVVTNLTTGETLFVAGKEFAGVESLACAALT